MTPASPRQRAKLTSGTGLVKGENAKLTGSTGRLNQEEQPQEGRFSTEQCSSDFGKFKFSQEKNSINQARGDIHEEKQGYGSERSSNGSSKKRTTALVLNSSDSRQNHPERKVPPGAVFVLSIRKMMNLRTRKRTFEDELHEQSTIWRKLRPPRFDWQMEMNTLVHTKTCSPAQNRQWTCNTTHRLIIHTYMDAYHIDIKLEIN